MQDDDRALALAALSTHFGATAFRPGQWKAIRAALEGRDCTVFLPTGTHTHTVVLLHGMYCPPSKCPSFIDLPEYVERLGMDGVKFVYPHAPRRTISWPTGPEPNVSSWYNYFTQRDGHAEWHDELDELQLQSQTSRLHGILDREAALLGGDARKVMLGGSSQGGTVALHAALA